jgi:hypothetical protein
LPPPYDKVLLTRGHYDGWNNQNTMSLFDVATLSLTPMTSTMSSRRSWHTATLLLNGKVLIVGGNNNVIATTSCGLVDPSDKYLTTPTANLNTGHLLYSTPVNYIIYNLYFFYKNRVGQLDNY